MTYFTIAQVKQANHAHGHFFFEPGAQRFFRSHIGRTVYGGHYFVTSEQYAEYPNGRRDRRMYTIRYANDDGSIDTVDDFQGYTSTRAAIARIRELLAFHND